MQPKRLILSSAELVSKEQQYMGQIHPLAYPLNGRVMFEHLYEKYKDEVDEINITCYEQKEKLINTI